MALETPNYINTHYAAQNRKEMGAAISKNSCKLEPAQFKTVLDAYDQSWHEMPSSLLFVPKPDAMIAKLIARKNKTGEARVQEDGLGECCEYLNKLMGGLPTQRGIDVNFIDHRSNAPENHITGTACRPDLVAIKPPQLSVSAQSPSQPLPESQSSEYSSESHVSEYIPESQPSAPESQKVSWYELESVVEFVSEGTTVGQGTEQGVAYTSYLLQQRPDRVAVCGLYISLLHFSLVLVDAAGVYSTRLHWDVEVERQLLLRVLYYIKDPPLSMVDPSITCHSDGTFRVKTRDQVYARCILQSCGHPTGRRTVIFRYEDVVIKEQYQRCTTSTNLEKTIFDRIHGDGEMPGVVRVVSFELVKRDDGTSVECGKDSWKREKVRFVLQDEGTPFMEITTPYEALVTVWDALEVTRCLFRERQVLHRDISAGNVMFMNSKRQSAKTAQSEFCTVRRLLNDSVPADDTRVLVIDFDHGEIKLDDDERKDEGKNRKKRQTVGTPIFMARSVVVGHPLATAGFFNLCGLPCLSEPAHAIYSKLLPERLERFPQPVDDQAANCVATSGKIDKDSLCSLPWTHELRHDGESKFWLLVWWAIHLRPKPSKSSKPSPPSEIKSAIYEPLTSIDLKAGIDNREAFLGTLAKQVPWLDPAYRELEPLFLQMAPHLTGDLYWAKGQMKEPDFLHEALQRIILNFLMKNQTNGFMHLEKDPNPREVEYQIRRHAPKQVTPSKRTHSTLTDDPEEEVEGPPPKMQRLEPRQMRSLRNG